LKNFKIPKQQFLEFSRLKPTQWKELSLEFEKFASSFGIGPSRRTKKPDIKTTADEIVVEIENEAVIKKNDLDEEDYEIWKTRILDDAYAALNIQNPNKC
ncbi:hypothetical protein JTB14_028194, partial [Gonioctena quinquepunctata]